MMNATLEGINEKDRTGLEDVTRAVRVLARSTRDLGESAAKVAERELSMAITIAEELRDRTISRETLTRVRSSELGSRLRRDAHRMVDLVADAAGVLTFTMVDFAEGFADKPRPALEAVPAPATGGVSRRAGTKS